LAEPTVTAAIPVRDGEAYLAEAIESVLAQSRPCDQVIVVDNGSSDGSAEIARGFGAAVEVVAEPRPGIGAARNAAVAAAPGLQLVFGHVIQFVSPEPPAAEAAALATPAGAQPGLYIGAMLARRGAIEAVGPWAEDVRVSDGLSFLLRARELGLAREMRAALVTRRRVHGANHSIHNRDQRAELARHLKRSLDRRRGAAR
jgi:glycosyltransferase involved in cell wall biosynthesis